MNAYLAKFIVPPYNNLKYVQLTNTDVSEDFSLQIEVYFLFIPNLKIYTKCKLDDESGNEITWLYGFTLTGNTCSFSVDKSKLQTATNVKLKLSSDSSKQTVKS